MCIYDNDDDDDDDSSMCVYIHIIIYDKDVYWNHLLITSPKKHPPILNPSPASSHFLSVVGCHDNYLEALVI